MIDKFKLRTFLGFLIGGFALALVPIVSVSASHNTTSTDSTSSGSECSTTQAVCSVNGYTYESECMAQE
ncbi:MAG: hypothetical protein ABEJ24_01100, partial [Candidatus Magasanikbacteria bacterium]